METLAQTPIHAWHAANGGKLVDFAGWAMPTHYDSIVPEHVATRQAAGLFDVSHMGRFCFHGPDAMKMLDELLTRRVSSLKPSQVRYSLVTNDQGGILDDVLVSCLEVGGQTFYWLVVNASNRQKLLDWIQPRLANYDLQFSDETTRTAMFALQGPLAAEIVDPMFKEGPPSQLGYYTAANGFMQGVPVTVSRTGYTGEDGFEFVAPADSAADIWQMLIDTAAPRGGRACGLGARDTLRLEAGMPLYGHELDEQTNPYEAGLGFAVQLKDRDFPGHAALKSAKAAGPQRVRVGLKLAGKRVPREGYAIQHEGQTVGTVTSGTFSPTLECPIAMGYVIPAAAGIGCELEIDLRGKLLPAEVCQLPFYQRS